MYNIIRQFREKGFTKTEISRETGFDMKTVRKYYSMSESEYTAYIAKVKNRTKNFEPFQREILDLYETNGNRKLTMAAVYDYLEEIHGKLPGTERSLRNYIDFLLTEQALVLKKAHRDYAPVPELPFGKQMQLDFAEEWTNCNRKTYLFVALLSASRFKYCSAQERPFTTSDLIQHLLNCFRFMDGMPEELAFDQDRLMVVSENHGDIIYTNDFKHFLDEMGLKTFVCRAADPESKGKVENLVKFVKGNFFSVRHFESFEELQDRLHDWLIRRANGKISTATRRIPAEMITVERCSLRPLRNSIYQQDPLADKEVRIVNKMSYISVDACQYPVPEEYRSRQVEIYKTNERLFVFDFQSGEKIADFWISSIPGKIIPNSRITGQRKKRLDEIAESLKGMFAHSAWTEFTEQTLERYKRYSRDQYTLARKYFSCEPDWPLLLAALQYCLENQTLGFTSLWDTYRYFQHQLEEPVAPVMQLTRTQVGKHIPPAVARRSMDAYHSRLKEVC